MVARKRLADRLRRVVTLYLLGTLVPVGLHLLLQVDPHTGGLYRALSHVNWSAEIVLISKLFMRFGIPGLIGLVVLVVWDAFRRHAGFERRMELQGKAVLLLPRPDQPPSKLDRIGLWGRLARVIPPEEHITFELTGGQLGIGFYVRAMPTTLRSVLPQIMAEWSGVRAVYTDDPTEDPLLAVGNMDMWWIEVRPSSVIKPLQAAAVDPLAAFLADIARLPDGVIGGLQTAVRVDPFARRRLRKRDATSSGSGNPKKSVEAQQEIRRKAKELNARARRTFLEARLIVWASAKDLHRARATARSLARTLLAQFGPSNPLRTGGQGGGDLPRRSFPLFAGTPWAENELAYVAHLVGQDVRAIAPQLRVAPAKPLPPSPASRVPEGATTFERK